VYAGKKDPYKLQDENQADLDIPEHSVLRAFLPIIVPIALIAMRSFFVIDTDEVSNWFSIVLALGDPVIALSIGVLLALNCKKSWKRSEVSSLLQDSAEKAGGILVIIGAGGAFGAVLEAARIGDHLNNAFSLAGLGIVFPFLLTVILKTAQGSSTVAIITASSIVQPLLPNLGVTTEMGYLLCVLSMGAGSMMISHANDAYFWVISKFSGVEMRAMLKVYSVASVLMGLVAFFVIFILSLILL
jgi:GntP family gluconate:H+ symporter